MEQFSNGAILKWSDLGSPPYAIFQDPKNREIWHAMCYTFTHNVKMLKVFQETNYQNVQDRVLPCTMQPWRLVRYIIVIFYPNPVDQYRYHQNDL